MKKFIETLVAMALIAVIAVASLALGIFIVANTGFEVHSYEKNAVNNFAVPVHAMIDGKTHHMFENKDTILDISYNK
jgi:UPF0716 family protein affecting phage T7 exclusion